MSLPFSNDEYLRRWQGVWDVFEAEELELALLHDADTIFYLTGFSGTPTTYQCLVVPRDGDPIHVLRYAEEATFRSSSWLERAEYWYDTDDPAEVLREVLAYAASDIWRVGVELQSTALSAARYARLHEVFEVLGEVTPIDISGHLGWQRLIKSDEEIAMYRRSVTAIEAGLAAGVAATVEGATEREIAMAVAPALIQAGCDTPLVGVIGSGERLGQVHGGLSDRRLQRGDLVRLEMSNAVNRYWARIMRMLSIGPPDHESLALYEELRALQDGQLAMLMPGAIPHDLDLFVRERLPEGVWAMQLSGYALAFHERSVIGGDADRYTIRLNEVQPVEAGMVLHMYLTVANISISETVLVTPDGSERLTTYPRELIVRDA
jgi:Xaa-Pro dipeptidase